MEFSQGPTVNDRAMMGTQKTPELLLLTTELHNEWDAVDEPMNLGFSDGVVGSTVYQRYVHFLISHDYYLSWQKMWLS